MRAPEAFFLGLALACAVGAAVASWERDEARAHLRRAELAADGWAAEQRIAGACLEMLDREAGRACACWTPEGL